MASLVAEVTHAEVTAMLELLGKHGVTRTHLSQFRGNADLAARVVQALVGGESHKTPVESVAAARSILGKFFFGAEEWSTHYGIAVPEVPEFPWSREILNSPCPFVRGRKIKDTHYAFLGVPVFDGEALSIMKLNELHPRDKQPKLFSSPAEAWYRQESFATEVVCQPRWYLLLKGIVPDSENKTWDRQLAMLPPEYHVPTGVEEVCKDLFCYQTAKAYLNRERYARVADTTSDGDRVDVGYGNPDGFNVGYWDGGPNPRIGIAASRKLPEA